MTDQRNYTSENAELVESKWLVKYPKFNYVLLAVWIFRDILGGGGIPPANSAPRHRSEKQKVRSIARQKSLRKYFNQFFAKVNIEVTKGNQMPISRFPEKSRFLRKCHVISETILGKRPGKKASIAIELLFR